METWKEHAYELYQYVLDLRRYIEATLHYSAVKDDRGVVRFTSKGVTGTIDFPIVPQWYVPSLDPSALRAISDNDHERLLALSLVGEADLNVLLYENNSFYEFLPVDDLNILQRPEEPLSIIPMIVELDQAHGMGTTNESEGIVFSACPTVETKLTVIGSECNLAYVTIVIRSDYRSNTAFYTDLCTCVDTSIGDSGCDIREEFYHDLLELGKAYDDAHPMEEEV
jgi:hypothetical protein